MKNFKHYKVIVLGAGVAGISCALFLKKYNINNILVLNKNTHNVHKACSGILTKRSLDILKEIGITPNDYRKWAYVKAYYNDNYVRTYDSNDVFAYQNIGLNRISLDNQLFEKLIEEKIEIIENVNDIFVDKKNNRVNEFTYDMDNPNGHSLLGGIIDKKCVCDGYASTIKYLCNEAGFNCNIVDGVGINNDVPEEHAWNLVQLNNKWYNVDATWGSANTATGKTIIYDYFLVSDDILSANHYRNGEYNYPSCDDESLFYFNMPGKYIKAYNDTEVCDSITSWINEGYKQFNLKFASNEDGQKACSELLEGGKFVKAFEKAADANYEITYGGSYDENAHMLRMYYEVQ